MRTHFIFALALALAHGAPVAEAPLALSSEAALLSDDDAVAFSTAESRDVASQAAAAAASAVDTAVHEDTATHEDMAVHEEFIGKVWGWIKKKVTDYKAARQAKLEKQRACIKACPAKAKELAKKYAKPQGYFKGYQLFLDKCKRKCLGLEGGFYG